MTGPDVFIEGDFGTDRLERSYVLQPFAGASSRQRSAMNYKKVYIFIAMSITVFYARKSCRNAQNRKKITTLVGNTCLLSALMVYLGHREATTKKYTFL
jgi:hypothetical protein